MVCYCRFAVLVFGLFRGRSKEKRLRARSIRAKYAENVVSERELGEESSDTKLLGERAPQSYIAETAC